jgi:hypothetical protein
MEIKDNNNQSSIEKLTAWMENLDGTPVDELREVLREMGGQDVVGDEEKFLLHVRALNQKLVAAESPPMSEGAGIIPAADLGLIGEAKSKGLTNFQLADLSKLSIVLITKLDRRLIRYASIPRRVIEDVAAALQSSFERVSTYLQGGPLRPADAFYSAEDEPTLPEPRDFFDEVRADPSISEDRRERLLAMGENK